MIYGDRRWSVGYLFLGNILRIAGFLDKNIPNTGYFLLIFLLNFYYFFGIVPF